VANLSIDELKAEMLAGLSLRIVERLSPTQERERAAAKAKPAEADHKAIADAQKTVAIWNARQAGGRALWFYPTIGAAIAGLPWLLG
jgi:hypothetical protein